MKIAVLSGKGGAGKTFVATNLAAAAKNSAYIDCDVEEPNGRIFFKPDNVAEKDVYTKIPQFDVDKCSGCRKCVDFCKFNAIVYLKGKPKVFSEVCHSCGGCELVCPEGAITETDRPVGKVEVGRHENIDVITGILNIGEASGIPVINSALETGMELKDFVVIDCPPGSACSVMESVEKSDFCILTAEPTAFGFHNFKMVYELVSILGKPCGVVINKMDMPYEPLEEFCRERNVPVLLRIPFSRRLAGMGAEGKLLYENDSETAEMFDRLLKEIGGAVL